MEDVLNTHINIGTSELGGRFQSVGWLHKIKHLGGYSGNLALNVSKPDGTPKKMTDVTRLHDLGWKHKIGFNDGLKAYY